MYKRYGCIWSNKIILFNKLTLHFVKVSCSNSPPLFAIVFWGETNRSSLSRMFFKLDVLKNFCKFHRKTPVLETLFNKVAGLKETSTQVFSCENCKIFKNTFFLRNTSGGCFWTKPRNLCGLIVAKGFF